MSVFFSWSSSQINVKIPLVFVFIPSSTSLVAPFYKRPTLPSILSISPVSKKSSSHTTSLGTHCISACLGQVFPECCNRVPVLYHPLPSKCYVLPPRALPCIFLVLIWPWPDMTHKEGHQLLFSILSKAAQISQDRKPPELRQTTTCSFLASYSQLSIPHSTTACLFLPSGTVVLLPCVLLKWIHKVAFQQEGGVTWSVSFAHMFTHSVWNTILWFALLSPNSSINSKSSQFFQPNLF